jgi:hypothetical protein
VIRKRRSFSPEFKEEATSLLLKIAEAIQRALLSTDDIQDIADGANSRAYLLDYFRLMRADGKLPVCTEPPPAKATEPPQSHPESAKAGKPTHEAMMNHVVACAACCAPQSRYCEQGADFAGFTWRPTRAPSARQELKKVETR